MYRTGSDSAGDFDRRHLRKAYKVPQYGQKYLSVSKLARKKYQHPSLTDEEVDSLMKYYQMQSYEEFQDFAKAIPMND